MNNDDEITVLFIEPEKVPREITITNSLESLQSTVGGYIQVVYPFDDNACIICNEEGKLNGMQLNRALRTTEGEIYDILAGPIIIAGLTEDDFGSLTAEQVETYSKMYHTPETFIMNDGKITVVPIRVERESDSFEIIEGVITLHIVVDDVTYPNHPIAHVTADVDGEYYIVITPIDTSSSKRSATSIVNVLTANSQIIPVTVSGGSADVDLKFTNHSSNSFRRFC